MNEHERLAYEESERIKALLVECGVSDTYINMLLPVIENTSWMKVKLDEAREKIKTSSVVIPYDNGGGQTGLRENPLFKGYESLFKSYMGGLKQIMDAMPEQAFDVKEAELEKPKTMLELVRSKHKKEA